VFPDFNFLPANIPSIFFAHTHSALSILVGKLRPRPPKRIASLSFANSSAFQARRPLPLQSILLPIEGQTNFNGLQRFLTCVHGLTREQRLSRFLYLASK